jgi:Mrp family chromosome partitioning ATPase
MTLGQTNDNFTFKKLCKKHSSCSYREIGSVFVKVPEKNAQSGNIACFCLSESISLFFVFFDKTALTKRNDSHRLNYRLLKLCLEDRMKVITIANNKGGVGKTMSSYQLACHLAHKGHRVLAIDLDSQGNLSNTLGVTIQRTLIPEWLIGDIEADDVIVKAEGDHEFYKNLWVIPSSRHMANLAKLLILSESEVRKNAGRKERLLKLRLKKIEDRFDYVVIDTPPMLGDELIMSLVASQLVLIAVPLGLEF